MNSYNKINILITGAGGQIGQGLLKLIQTTDKFNEIWTVAKDQNDVQQIESIGKFEILEMDISAPIDEKMINIFKKIDVVVHLAAMVHNPKAKDQEYYDINYTATKNLIEGFKKYSKAQDKQFVYISSVSVYGNYKATEYSESDDCFPDTPYAKSKLLAENAIKKICMKDDNVKYTIIRPATVYCKNDKGNVGKMISFIKKYHFFPIFGDGNNKKSLIYINDVIDGIHKCIFNKNVFNESLVLSSEGYSINEIVNVIKKVYNINVLIVKIPVLILKKLDIVKKLTMSNIFSYHKASKLIEYKPVSLLTGLRELLKNK